MENHKIRVAITQGDTNGVGLELIFKTFADQEMFDLCTPIVYASPKVASYHSNALETQCQFSIINNAKDARDGRVNLVPCFEEEVKVELGVATAEAATAGVKALDKALADRHNGVYDVLVCGPMNGGEVRLGTMTFPCTTRFIETSLGEGAQAEAIHMNSVMRVALASNSCLKDITLTQDVIEQKVRVLHQTVKRDFNITNPRIAVLALNPTDGAEETGIITPAINTLVDAGIQVFGPYHADDFFATRKHEAFDAILAMHHDQGLLPLRMLTDEVCTVLIANLPLVCTTTGTDAQHQIAGKNTANEAVLRNAIYTATDVFRHRQRYDQAKANPLPKLYHERPDNGEKLRFSIPKKKEQEAE